MEDYKKSKIEAETTIKIDPEYSYAYYNLANALKFLGEIDEAIKVYKKYENTEPGDPDFDLAELYFQKEEYKKSLQEVNIVMRFDRYKTDASELKLKIPEIQKTGKNL